MLEICDAKLVARFLIAKDTYEFVFETLTNFAYKAGQYVWIILPEHGSVDPKGNRRAFSISSAPLKNNTFSVIFRTGPSVFKQSLMALKEGAEVKVRGPAGSSFVINDLDSDNICFIGGGVGSTPFVSILRSYEFLTKKPHITFINLNSSEEKIFLSKEISEICQKNNLKFLNRIGRFNPKDITDDPNYNSAVYFICGVQGLVNDVFSKLQSVGISEEKMHFEEFYPIKDQSLFPLIADGLKSGFRLAVESASNHIIVTDTNGVILFANDAATKITGFSNSEMVGQTPRLWGAQMSPSFYKEMWKLKKNGQSFSARFNNTRKDGEKYIAFARISPILGIDKSIIGYVGTEEDITKAVETDKMKSDFILLTSHQLRNPLSAMRWLLEMLINGDAGQLTGHQLEYIKNIKQSNQKMIELVNQLLNISRIESGRLSIVPIPTKFDGLIAGVIEQSKVKAAEKKINLSFEVDPNLPLVNTDPKLIAQVYQNLLDNAIEYTPVDGWVKILVGADKQNVVSQVIDSGIGIPEDEKNKIYNRFYRASNAIRNNVEGIGLGLYLVKAIVEVSGGKTWFESTVDKGTTFYFSLPLTGTPAKKGEVSLS